MGARALLESAEQHTSHLEPKIDLAGVGNLLLRNELRNRQVRVSAVQHACHELQLGALQTDPLATDQGSPFFFASFCKSRSTIGAVNATVSAG